MAERTVRTDRVYHGRLLSLRVDEVELASGRHTTREIVEHPGAVGILAWDGSRLALVRQWRQPAGTTLLEIPAGTREPGEAPASTAARELAEEVGVSAGSWEAGPEFYTAPGFCTELLSLHLATDLRIDRGAEPEADEELDLEWRSLDAAVAAIDAGEIRDAKSVAGILWLARRLAGVSRA
jgi:ADP-ribose diphosphatase